MAQLTQAEQAALEHLADLLMEQDDRRGQPDRGAALVEVVEAWKIFKELPTNEDTDSGRANERITDDCNT